MLLLGNAQCTLGLLNWIDANSGDGEIELGSGEGTKICQIKKFLDGEKVELMDEQPKPRYQASVMLFKLNTTDARTRF